MRGPQVRARAGGTEAPLRDPRLLPGTRHLRVGDPLFKAALDTTTLLNFLFLVGCPPRRWSRRARDRKYSSYEPRSGAGPPRPQQLAPTELVNLYVLPRWSSVH